MSKEEKPIDPKAQEYGQTLANLTLMQAEIDGLKEQVTQLTTSIAESFVLMAKIAKAVQQLQKWWLKK